MKFDARRAKRLQPQEHIAFDDFPGLRTRLRIGRYRVRMLMREAGLRTSWKRKFISTIGS
jgi:hypothetical protein